MDTDPDIQLLEYQGIAEIIHSEANSGIGDDLDYYDEIDEEIG